MKQKMIDNKISRNQEFFFKNCVNSVGGKARILCMIDATGSMGSTINQVKGKVMDMIDNLASKYPGQFEIQLMFYYGDNAYNSQKGPGSWHYLNKIHCSQWSSNTNNLRKFMATVTAGGGSSHEAIELGLHHLLLSSSEVGVKKGILIGDDGLACNSTSNMPYHVHPEDKHRYKGR